MRYSNEKQLEEHSLCLVGPQEMLAPESQNTLSAHVANACPAPRHSWLTATDKNNSNQLHHQIWDVFNFRTQKPEGGAPGGVGSPLSPDVQDQLAAGRSGGGERCLGVLKRLVD